MIEHILQLFTSLILGALIGLEREKQDKPAGLRDTMLVCLGSTLFTIISLILMNNPYLGGGIRYDTGRIIAYTIASIGFLGSGVIIQKKGDVEGVTTAAMLWAIVGVGILVGLSQYVLSIVSSIFILITLRLKHLDRSKDKKFNHEKE